jgi:hypothetical protein
VNRRAADRMPSPLTLAVVIGAYALIIAAYLLLAPNPQPEPDPNPQPKVERQGKVERHTVTRTSRSRPFNAAPRAYYTGEQAAIEHARQIAEWEAELERQRRATLAPRPHGPARQAVTGSVWDRLAQCESGGNWHINTGNGYYGGLQFSASSWAWVGGHGLPHEHSRETQIAMAERLLARQGWGAWPSCSRRLGLR